MLIINETSQKFINESVQQKIYMPMFLKGNSPVNSLLASVVAVTVLATSFALFEPIVSHGQASETFLVTQEIASQISFLTAPADVTMSGSAIQGLTGGIRYGTTTFNITTNDPQGYNVEIAFSDTVAMNGIDDAAGSSIENYLPAGGIPSYSFSVAAGDTAFAYTVESLTSPGDIDPSFNDNGTNACNTGSGTSTATCWYNEADATAGEVIINASGPTAGTGATSSVVFAVGVGANPSPALEAGFYVATATLTATVNP